ncbi:MAG: GDSL-type esterase/lipase family protein, partial [Oscillospiraceae bacterium]
MKKKILIALSLVILTACSETNDVPAEDISASESTSASSTMLSEETRIETTQSITEEKTAVSETISDTETFTEESVTSEEASDITELTEFISYADEDHVKISGRTLYENDVRYLGYTCSAVEFTFCGTYAEIELIPEPMQCDNDEYSYYSVLLDSEEIFRGLLKEQTVFCAVDSDTAAEHTVKLTKLSEGCFGAVGVGYIRTVSYDEIRPTQPAGHRIEFIGDSLTCGYGDEASGAEEHFSTSTENGLIGYAALTAERLGFDYNIVGMNGIGIVSRYTPHGEKRTEGFLMPELYRYTDGFRSDEIWDSSRFVPDICVIALGANDNSYTLGIESREEEFSEGYAEFIKQVRAANPDAYILCVSGIQRSNLYDV